jgi:predicted DNA-binding transcriptional regulator AlpA
MENEKPPRLLRATEVAERLNIDPRRVYELAIPRVRLSRKSYRWDSAALEEFIRDRSSVRPTDH